MKAMVGSVLALLIATSAFATLSKDEVKRLSDAAAMLTQLRNAPDKGIPQELWEKAHCVIAIPDLKKAAFIIGGEYGSGVMSCRTKDGWSAPIFMQLAKGSWGLQIGAQEMDLVLLVMNEKGMSKLLEDKVTLGADVSVAAGPVGRGASAATDAQLGAEMLAYSRTAGLFAGINISGGSLSPDKNALARTYGPNVTPRAVVTGVAKVTVPTEAMAFTQSLRRNVGATGRE